jgi:hypothetical protein
MQVAQRKTKQKAQQKPKATSIEAFAVEHEDMFEYKDASNNIKEMPEIQEFLDNVENELCNHVILNKSETQFHTTDPTVVKLE